MNRPDDAEGLVETAVTDGSRPLGGRWVLVTGGAGDGIAAGICAAVHAAGGRLVVNDLSEELLARVLSRYPSAVGIVGDIGDPEDAERVIEVAAERCGPITALVNNAGVGLAAPFFEASVEQFDRVFAVDVRGMWMVTRAFARQLREATLPGAIVNISSVHARATMERYATYAAAKAAVEGFTRGCALELASRGVRCNAVAPGYVHSEQNADLLASVTADPGSWVERHRTVEQPLARLIEPVDIGWTVAFLLSERSRCITGQTVYVDSGLSARLYNREALDLDYGAVAGQ